MVNEPSVPRWMWKDIIIVCSILFFVVALGFSAFSYNLLVEKDVAVLQKYANVQTSLERRADLIPNTIASIQGSQKFESSTLEKIVELRSQAGQIRYNVSMASNPEQIQAHQDSLSNAIGRLLLIYEQYPTLKTTDQFLKLETQLSDTEDQIVTARREYNSAVMDYQQVTRSVPTNIFAAICGFKSDKYSMFAADQKKQDVPIVSF